MSKLKNELRNLQDENQNLCNEIKSIREDYGLYHSSLVEIVNLSSLSPTVNDIARKALTSTGTTGCPAGPEGVNGIFKNTKELK